MSVADIMSCSLGWIGYQLISDSSCWPGNPLQPWGLAPISLLSWRQVPANRCSISSLEKTVLPLIQAHGGWLAKAKRFADDDAQDLTHSSRRGGRRGDDAARGTAADHDRHRRQGGRG